MLGAGAVIYEGAVEAALECAGSKNFRCPYLIRNLRKKCFIAFETSLHSPILYFALRCG